MNGCFKSVPNCMWFMFVVFLSIKTGALKVARYEEEMFPHFVAKLSTICPATKC